MSRNQSAHFFALLKGLFVFAPNGIIGNGEDFDVVEDVFGGGVAIDVLDNIEIFTIANNAVWGKDE